MNATTESALKSRLSTLLAGRGEVASTQVRNAVADSGLTPRSAFTLAQLASGPVSQQALIDLLGVDPSALVTTLNDLEKLGLVSRDRDPDDRRRHIVRITDEGTRVLRAVEKTLDGTDDVLFAALSSAECAELQRLLDKVADASACAAKV